MVMDMWGLAEATHWDMRIIQALSPNVHPVAQVTKSQYSADLELFEIPQIALVDTVKFQSEL